jgi:hypothetical protein
MTPPLTPAALAQALHDVPGPVAHLVERLTRRDANERYDDWASVLAAVDAVAARLA